MAKWQGLRPRQKELVPDMIANGYTIEALSVHFNVEQGAVQEYCDQEGFVIETYPCPECDKVYQREQDLKTHITKTHTE